MKRNILTLLLIITVQVVLGQPALMPVPSSMKVSPGKYRLDAQFRIAVQADPKDDILYPALTRAYQSLNRRTGLYFRQQQITASDKRSDAPLQINVSKKAEPEVGADESYTLIVSEEGIKISSLNTLGALHGIETLQQLLQRDSTGYYFPLVDIHDSPRFPWRGIMIDVARHFLPMDVMLRNIDAMAAVKMNVLHLHLSDDEGFRVESKVYPLLQEKGSNGQYFTQSQIKEMIGYARARGIVVYPEFDLPGHSRSWFAGYPELASAPGPFVPGPRFDIDPEKDTKISIAAVMASPSPTIDPTKESTYTFLDKLFKEMIALFPSPYFHIGADENNGAAWKNNPAIVEFMKQKKMAEPSALQAYFVSRCYTLVKKYGKTMVGWEELNSPELPKDVIVHKWLEEGGGMMKSHGSPAQIAAKGNRVIISTGFYLDRFLPAYIHYLNENFPSENNSNYMGGEAAQWTEIADRNNAELRIWPRAAAIAERLWSPASVKDVDDMYRRLFNINKLLDEQGIQQVSQYETGIRTLCDRSDLATVRSITDLLTPVKGYKKLFSRFSKSAVHMMPTSPIKQISDVIPVESETRYEFRMNVKDYLETKNPLSEQRIRTQLARWQEVSELYTSVSQGNARLSEVNSHAEDLNVLSTMGLSILENIKSGTPYREEDLKKVQDAIDKAKKNTSGDVELAMIPEIESLLKKKLIPEPKQFGLF